MIAYSDGMSDLTEKTQAFYRRSVKMLNEAEVPFLIGGAYALAHRTGIVRHTKDLDVFVRAADSRRALDVFATAGFRTELTFSHWLGKVFRGEDFVDIIFSSGNGLCKVDDLWFLHSLPATLLGEPIRLCPVEETIWSKSFVCERERFDGADINHLLLDCGRELDWARLLGRFDSHWRVLLAHLMLFGFTYPSERGIVPGWVMDELTRRLVQEGTAEEPGRVCRGTLLSRIQYVTDLDHGEFADGRLGPECGLTAEQAWVWTEAGLLRQ